MARTQRTRTNSEAAVAAMATSPTSIRTRRPAAKRTAPRSRPSTTAAGIQPEAQHRFQLTLCHKIAAIVWMSIIIVVVMAVFRERIAQLGNWGYLGAFLINGISSASVVLPAPGGAIILLMAADYHWLPLGIAAGVGGTLGSLTAYLVGAQARPALEKRRFYDGTRRIMNRFGYIILFLLTIPPVSPGDFGGILAGATRYPLRKYLVAVGLASIVKMVALTYGAAISLAWLERWSPSWSRLLPG